MRNNLFGTITPSVMMEGYWGGGSSRKVSDDHDDDSLLAKIKEKKESLKVNGVNVNSIKGKDYKLSRDDVKEFDKNTQKSLLKINLSDIDTIHALDTEVCEAFNYVATSLSNLVFEEIDKDDVKKIAKVGKYVSEEKYRRAVSASGVESLKEFVETREAQYKVLSDKMIEQMETLNRLKAITDIVSNKEPEHKRIMTTALELFKKKYSDIDTQLTALENQITSCHEMEIDLEAQKIIINKKIESTRSMIDTYHNNVRVSLNRIKTLKSLKEGLAHDAWTGEIQPHILVQGAAAVAYIGFKFLTRDL